MEELKQIKDLKEGDNVYILESFGETIKARPIINIYEENNYFYFLLDNKILCYGKGTENTLYSERTYAIHVNKEEAIEKILSKVSNSIESAEKQVEKLQKEYETKLEDLEFYINRKNKELIVLKETLYG